MSDDDLEDSYPDPYRSIETPYTASSFANDHIQSSGPYGDPRRGGLWQAAGPSAHEGFTDRGNESDFTDDEDLQALYSDFNLKSVIGNAPRSSQIADSDFEVGGPSQADRGLDAEYQLSDDVEDDSEGNSSLDEDLLDEALFATTSSRGRGGGRGRGRGRPRGGGRGRGWKWALKGTEHDPNFGKRGRPRGRPRGSKALSSRKGLSAKAADPGEEFKKQQARAMERFLAKDYEAAAELARAAVRANPEVFAAHSLLAEVLSTQGKHRDSLTVLLAGAHTKRDPQLWKQVGERTQALAGETQTVESLDAASYCYGWAVRLDSKDYDARRRRLNCLLESFTLDADLHIASRARVDCRALLKLHPEDILVARELAELAVLSTGKDELDTALAAYDIAFKQQPASSPFGNDCTEDEQWNHTLAYVNLIERLEDNTSAIKHFKRLARVVQKRQDEQYWDDFPDDDREFDVEDEPRKNQVKEYEIQKKSDVNCDLPLDLRIKLGFYRLALDDQHFEEAVRHFRFLLAERSDVGAMVDLFRDVADALKSKSRYADAIPFYEPLQNEPDSLDMDYYMDLGTCYRQEGRVSDAETCLRIVVDNNADDWEARIALAKIYEDQGRRSDALPLINDVIRLGKSDTFSKGKARLTLNELRKHERRRDINLNGIAAEDQAAAVLRGADENVHGSLFDQVILDLGLDKRTEDREKARAKKKRAPSSRPRSNITNATLERQRKLAEQVKNLRSVQERVQSNYQIATSCEADVAAGDEEATAIWKSAVQSMIDEFKMCKYLFSGRDKHSKFQGYGRQSKIMQEMEAMRSRMTEDDDRNDAPRLNAHGIPDDYCNIKFDIWLDLFCELALLYAREGDQESSYSVLEAVMASNVFYHSAIPVRQIHTTWLSCSLLLNDEERLTTATRFFMSTYPASETPYQIFAAAHRIYSGPTNWFNAGPTQKYLLRALKAFDYHVMPSEQRSKWPFTDAERRTFNFAMNKNVGWDKVRELPASFLTLYGHVMAAAQTWTSALNYYYRALALRPDDPLIMLCIGMAYVQGSMKRQSENRHWSILTGLGFLSDYRRVRIESGGTVYKQEAEYNIARVWHFLGLIHLAKKGYEKCLRLGDDIAEERKSRMDVDDQKTEWDSEEYTQEAAHGLVNICMVTGQVGRAKAITERYLVI